MWYDVRYGNEFVEMIQCQSQKQSSVAQSHVCAGVDKE